MTLELGEHTRSTEVLMRRLRGRLEDFHAICGRYPYTNEGLDILFNENGRVCSQYFLKYGSTRPDKIDAWGNDLIYSSDGNSYKLVSLGYGWIIATSEIEPKVMKLSR